jgi:hypothetical protein
MGFWCVQLPIHWVGGCAYTEHKTQQHHGSMVNNGVHTYNKGCYILPLVFQATQTRILHGFRVIKHSSIMGNMLLLYVKYSMFRCKPIVMHV